MAISLTKKPKASKSPSLLDQAMAERATPLVSGLDLTNRATRTPLGWVTDGSPSMTGFTQQQLDSAVSMVAELAQLPITSRSVLMNIVQIGTPPVSTGFQEIGQFQVPPLNVAKSTPLHTALDQLTNDLGGLCSDLRVNGIERTDSVVIITTDGFANDTTPEILAKSIDAFLAMGKKWSVTNLVVGVGTKLNTDLLKKLANVIPPLLIEELNAAVLMPFIQKIARKVSESRRGQKIELELPDGIETIE
ncbi:MAG: hypothetical protein U0798_06875 [Gemmataceae bacterium]